MEAIWEKSRDNSRAPMQWDDSHAAGVTTGTPWIKVNSNYKEINVQKELEDEDSIYLLPDADFSSEKAGGFHLRGIQTLFASRP